MNGATETSTRRVLGWLKSEITFQLYQQGGPRTIGQSIKSKINQKIFKLRTIASLRD